jgi:hypothetical protein
MTITDIILNRCPSCRQVNMFKRRFPYSLGHMTNMHAICPKCGLKFEREPGFFYGAMYVSYAINIALFVIAIIFYYSGFVHITSGQFILGFIALVCILSPIIFRLSRTIWLYANFRK